MAKLWYERNPDSLKAMAQELRHVPIDVLDLSKRTYNALLRHKPPYDSVGDLIAAGDALMSVRNLGQGGVREIDAQIRHALYRTIDRTLIEASGQVTPELDSGHDVDVTESRWFQEPLEERQAVASEMRSMPIEAWNLSPVAERALQRHDWLGSVGSVVMMTPLTVSLASLSAEVIQELDARIQAIMTDTDPSVTAWLRAVDTVARFRPPSAIAALHADTVFVNEDLERVILDLGVNTLADLGQLSRTEVIELVSSSPKAADQLVQILACVSSDAVSDRPDQLDLAHIWRIQGVTVLPTATTEPSPHLSVNLVTAAIREAVHITEDERTWLVLQRRYGLAGTEKRTLQSIGDALGVTRERIRQIEAAGLNAVRTVVFGHELRSEGVRLAPNVSRWIRTMETVATESEPGIRHSTLMSHATAELPDLSSRVDPLVRLAMDALGASRIRVDSRRRNDVWSLSGDATRRAVKNVASAVRHLVRSHGAQRVDEIDLLSAVNSPDADQPVALDTLHNVLPLIPQLRRMADGSYRVRFWYLQSRADQFERILMDHGDLMHLDEIRREINHRLAAENKRTISRDNLSNQLAADERFVAVGRSGYWGLARWEDLETATIRDVMLDVLRVQNEPLTAVQIHELVSQRRPAQLASIKIYLQLDERFGRIDRKRWGLSSWREVKVGTAWDSSDVVDLVRRVLPRSDSVAPLAEVRSMLMESAGVSASSANGMLAHCSGVVITEERDGERSVRLADASRRTKRRGSVRDAVLSAAQEILSESGDEELPLSDVVAAVLDRVETTRSTVYAYLKQAAFLEYRDSPDQPGKRIRLLDAGE